MSQGDVKVTLSSRLRALTAPRCAPRQVFSMGFGGAPRRQIPLKKPGEEHDKKKEKDFYIALVMWFFGSLAGAKCGRLKNHTRLSQSGTL